MSTREKPRQPIDSLAVRPLALDEAVIWHTLTVPQAAAKLDSDVSRGISEQAARHRLHAFGPNRLSSTRGRSAASIFLAQFQSLIVLLLVAATLIAFTLGEQVEGGAILVVIVLNATVGFLTEWKAERALTALQKQAVPVAHVIRSGVQHQVLAAELVPGDVVILSAGERVPSDGRIIEAARLQIDGVRFAG